MARIQAAPEAPQRNSTTTPVGWGYSWRPGTAGPSAPKNTAGGYRRPLPRRTSDRRAGRGSGDGEPRGPAEETPLAGPPTDDHRQRAVRASWSYTPRQEQTGDNPPRRRVFVKVPRHRSTNKESRRAELPHRVGRNGKAGGIESGASGEGSRPRPDAGAKAAVVAVVEVPQPARGEPSVATCDNNESVVGYLERPSVGSSSDREHSLGEAGARTSRVIGRLRDSVDHERQRSTPPARPNAPASLWPTKKYGPQAPDSRGSSVDAVESRPNLSRRPQALGGAGLASAASMYRDRGAEKGSRRLLRARLANAGTDRARSARTGGASRKKSPRLHGRSCRWRGSDADCVAPGTGEVEQEASVLSSLVSGDAWATASPPAPAEAALGPW